MKLRNHEIAGFGKFLMSLELSGKKSRMRTRLVKLLQTRQELIDTERLELLKELADKDEKNEPKVETNENGQTIVVLSEVNQLKFNQQYIELLNEVFVIDETDERRDMLLAVKDAILECDLVFSGQEALDYDRFCEIVEEIEYVNG